MYKHFLLSVFILFGVITLSQKLVNLPQIEGTPDDDVAPEGWAIEETSPDIVIGNGPWPMGSYTVADVNGGTVSGKTMGLFLSSDQSIKEGWKTTLNKLEQGESYAFSFQWQQASLLSGEAKWYCGGELLVIVDGDSTIFRSDNVPEHDRWQMANVMFTAKSNTAQVIVKIHVPQGTYSGTLGGAIVIDNVCKECSEAGAW